MRLAYNGANASYNSLQTSLTGTVKHDLHLQVSYTLAKAMDATTVQRQWRRPLKRHQSVSGMAVRFRSVGLRPQERVLRQLRLRPAAVPERHQPCAEKQALGGWQLSGHHYRGIRAHRSISGVSGTTAASIISNSGTRPNVSGSISYPEDRCGMVQPCGVLRSDLRSASPAPIATAILDSMRFAVPVATTSTCHS